jgi:histidine triad (HIT) family protein
MLIINVRGEKRMSAQEEREECFVCRKHRGLISMPGGAIYEDDLVYAGHILLNNAGTAYLGWLVAETKRHTPGLAEVTDSEAQALGLLMARLSRALKACEGAEHIYSFVLGDGVPHLHIHVVPRYPGTPREYWGTRIDEWPDAPRGDAAQVAALCERVREYLKSGD